DVALPALRECRGRAARSGIEDRNVAEQPNHELLGLFETAQLLAGVAPGGEVVPACSAAGLRVGGDDLHVRADEVAPIANLLRIPLADKEDDGRIIWRAVVGQTRLPIGRN